jgi:hypothetical protein
MHRSGFLPFITAARVAFDQANGRSLRRTVMIDHTGIGVVDVGRSAAFHDMALEALGLRGMMQILENVGSQGIGYGVSFPIFWIDRFHVHSMRQHTAFCGEKSD